MRYAAGVMAGLVLLACRESRPAGSRAGADSAAAVALPDSLALSAPSGVEVWFTGARPASDRSGKPCTERALEIRREGRVIPIPLLYTGRAPVLVNDSTIRADLWFHCEVLNTYTVSLRTGFPTRVSQ